MESENTNLIVYRSEHNQNYKTISLTCISDKRLSWKAKGLHNYLITRPDNWEAVKEDLIDRSTDGPTSFYSGMNELIRFGYVFRMVKKNERRQFVKGGYYTVETPISIEEAISRIESFGWEISQKDPDQENPDRGFPDPENQSYTNKYSTTIEGNVTTVSKETDGSTEPSLELIYFDNLRTIKIGPYRNLEKGVEELFDYWNSLKDPIPHHEEKKSKIFAKSLEGLDLLLKRGYSKDEIKQSMSNYEWLLTSVEGFKLNRVTYGTVVSLPEFIEFSKFAIDKIRSGNKDLVKNKVVSWFEECLNTREDLEVRWSKLVKDEYPKETQKLKELWKRFGGRKLQGADDENIMRRIAIKAYNYFENLNGKYQWGLTERYPIARLHHLFDVGQAEGWDWGKAQPSFLLSPKMFLEKLPAHWERIALAGAAMSPTMESKMEIDNKDLREVNSHFGWDENGSREKTLAVIASQQSNRDEDENLEDY